MSVGAYTSLFSTPSSPFTTVGPLAVIVGITMGMEARDDLKRHRADAETSARPAQTVDGSKTWREIEVGDVLLIQNKELVPADVVVLATSEEDGIAYVETSNIDGETNLKIRSAPTSLFAALAGTPSADLERSLSLARTLSGRACTELPNDSINTFKASFQRIALRGPKGRQIRLDDVPLGPKQLVLRGCALRNTRWLIGLVVFTGEDTKVARNSKKRPAKMSNIDRTMNALIKQIILVQCVLVALTVGCMLVWQKRKFGGGDGLYDYTYEDFWYLFPAGEKIEFSLPDAAAFSFTFFILYCQFVPISLYVTVEMVNQYHAHFVNNDVRMWDPETDTAAAARTANLCSELGQVEYIFTDKTGTLTQNVMVFKRCSIGGRIFGDPDQDLPRFQDAVFAALQAERPAADEELLRDVDLFLLNMAINHTVVAEADDAAHWGVAYQAESPDEGALADAAGALGFRFADRNATHLFVNQDSRSMPDDAGDRVAAPKPNGSDKEASGHFSLERRKYECLAINAFNSTRKRSSMVVRTPSGRVLLLVKGADNVMLDRSERGPGGYPVLSDHLTQFSKEGLRTLVFGVRELEEAEAMQWLSEYRTAACALEDRRGALMRVAEKIEGKKGDTFLRILGASAIEDKLQVGVGDTIATCHRAGIKLWVLTGDKMETAINIGYSCRVLSRDDMKILKMKHDPKATSRQNRERIARDLGIIVGQIRKIKAGAAADARAALATQRSRRASTLGAGALSDLEILEPDIANLALVVTGPVLDFVLDDDSLRAHLLEIGRETKVVIACRVSPLQKALLVRMVKRGVEPTPITLAIGDGANDCSMIQEAHVGVGISGREGMQAANSADFAISQFRFLKRLLLIHGRWDYRRVAKCINYSLYKNVVMTITLFMYNFLTGFSGTLIYEGWMYSGYACFLFAGPVAIGVFDKDVREATVLEHPELYVTGLKQLDLNRRRLVEQVALAAWHGTVVIMVPALGYNSFDDGSMSGLYCIGTMIFSALFFVMLYRNCFIFWTYNRYVWYSIWVSIFLLFLFFCLYGMVFAKFMNPAFYWVPIYLMGRAAYWLALISVVAVSVLGDLALKYFQREYSPELMDLCQELDRLDEQERRRRGEGDERPIFRNAMADLVARIFHAGKASGTGGKVSEGVDADVATGQRQARPSVVLPPDAFPGLHATTSHDPSSAESRAESREVRDSAVGGSGVFEGATMTRHLRAISHGTGLAAMAAEAKRRERDRAHLSLLNRRRTDSPVKLRKRPRRDGTGSQSHHGTPDAAHGEIAGAGLAGAGPAVKGPTLALSAQSQVAFSGASTRTGKDPHRGGGEMHQTPERLLAVHKPKFENRPDEKDAFLQQTLPAWQPVVTPKETAIALFLVSALCVTVGTVMIVRSDNAIRYMVQYEGQEWSLLYPEQDERTNYWGANAVHECTMSPRKFGGQHGIAGGVLEADLETSGQGGGSNGGGNGPARSGGAAHHDKPDTPAGGEATCTIDIFVGERMQAPIYVMYWLDDFFQNYQTYVSSVDWWQLTGSASYTSGGTSDLCNRPSYDYFKVGKSGMDGSGSGTCELGATLAAKDLSANPPVEEDVECRWLEPCGLMANSFFNDTFSVSENLAGCTCEDIQRTDGRALPPRFSCAECQVHRPVLRTSGIAWGSDLEIFENIDHSAAEAAETQFLWETYKGVVPEDKGVTFEQFIVWMRPAFLDQFSKRWARIDEDIPANSQIRFEVTSRFPTHTFGGKKALILSTDAAKATLLPASLIGIGVVAFAVGVAVLVHFWTHGSRSGKALREGIEAASAIELGIVRRNQKDGYNDSQDSFDDSTTEAQVVASGFGESEA
jgi:phospholipid-translocating P-type ATPase (flippase)